MSDRRRLRRRDRSLVTQRGLARNQPAPGSDSTAATDRNRARPKRRRFRWQQLMIVFLSLLAVWSVANTVRGAPAPEPPLIGLSDVDDFVRAGLVERAGLDERAQRVAIWIGPEGRQEAVRAMQRFAGARGESQPPLVEDRDELVLVAFFPLQFADELTSLLIEAEIPLDSASAPSGRSPWIGVLTQLLPLVVILGFVALLMNRRGNGPKLAKGRGGEVEVPDTSFDDVAGVDEAVEDLRDLVVQLTTPERFAGLGVRAPRGVLLAGPPGTGKTLLARAVAGEAGVAFFALAGSDFVDTYVGVGARRVRDLFDNARKAGRAVVFIDEIDAIGKKRSTRPGGGNDESERTLNALLVELDGFDESSEVVVLAATNRADLLDDALTRPGRFDRQVTIPAPDRAGRLAVLEVHARKLTLGEDVDLATLARRTTGMTGAELANLLNTAAINAARDGERVVGDDHVEDALQTLAMGRARPTAMVSSRDRVITAWHESGHALLALVQPAANDPLSVTIVPRGPSGGTTWMDGDDRVFMQRSQALAQLVTAMGGRAAEELLLDGDFTQGASSDLQQATTLARRMIAEYGMGDTLRIVGPGRTDEVDEAVEKLLRDALETARDLLRRHRAAFEQLVTWLLEDETVGAERLQSLRHAVVTPPEVLESFEQNAASAASRAAGRDVPADEVDLRRP